MKPALRLASFGAALLFSVPLSAFELEHSDGKQTMSSVPAKIVTFDLAALDTLHALGVPVAGVPKSSYAGALAAFQNTAVVGTLFEPDYPALRQLQPDLIIAGGRSAKAIPELQKVAPTVSFTSDPDNFLESFDKTNRAIARAFDKEEQAEAALAAIDGNINALHKTNEGKTGAFLFVVRGNVMAHVPGDRFGYAYEVAGLKSVLPAKDPAATAAPRAEPGSPQAAAAARARAEAISKIAQADPDWLIVLDRGAINNGEKTAEATLVGHPELSQTRAFKTGKVYYGDPNGWYVIGGGLNNFKAITDAMLAVMK